MHLLSVLVLASIYIPAVVCRGAHVCVICSCMGIVSYLCIVVFVTIDFILIFGVVTPLSAIFQLYHGDQLQRWKKQEYPERTTDHEQTTGQLYHMRLRAECTFFVIYKTWREPTPYELLGNPTTQLIDPPGPFVFVGLGTHVVFVLFVFSYLQWCSIHLHNFSSGRCGRDRMVVGFTTTCAISVYHH